MEDILGRGEFLASTMLMDKLADNVCDEDSNPEFCSSILFLMCGFDSEKLNVTLLDTIFHHTPAGTSVKTLVHYGQELGPGTIFIIFPCFFYIGRLEI